MDSVSLKINGEKYLSSIAKKYSIPNGRNKDPYILLDAYEEFTNGYENSNLIFKGAFNLVYNFNYSRVRTTRDMDFSTTEDVEGVMQSLIEALNKHNGTQYKFENAKFNEVLKIPRSKQKGVSIRFEVFVKDTKINATGFIDLVEEEIKNSKLLINSNGKIFYSKARSLIDKVNTVICRGMENTREWDATDILYLYPEVELNEEFKKEFREACKLSEVTSEEFSFFKDNYEQIAKKLKCPKVAPIFKELINKLDI